MNYNASVIFIDNSFLAIDTVLKSKSDRSEKRHLSISPEVCNFYGLITTYLSCLEQSNRKYLQDIAV